MVSKIVAVVIRGQAPDSEGGGVIWTRYSRGEDFFGFLGGIYFLTSKGGISFRLLYKNFKNFPKFSKIFQNFQARGGTRWIFGSNFSKRGEYFAKESPS